MPTKAPAPELTGPRPTGPRLTTPPPQFLLHEPTASMAATPVPPTLWTADTWEEAVALEQAMSAGHVDPEPQTVS